MNFRKTLFFLCLIFLIVHINVLSQTISVEERIKNERSNDKEMEEYIDKLIDQMTLKEKIGQMIQLAAENILIEKADEINKNLVTYSKDWAIDTAKLGRIVREYHVGSWLQGKMVAAKSWCKFNTIIQEVTLKNSRLKIPLIFGIDIIHGATPIKNGTMFPQNINLAASFNKDISYQSTLISSAESARFGFHWVFNPELDLGHNIEWGRFFETYGEDPYLCGVMGSIYTKALQENDKSLPYKQAACARHYMGYSDPWSGKDRTPSEISDQKLHEFFKPSFKAAIDSGLMSVMVCSGEVSGTPVHMSKKILTDILRNDLGFTGVVLSDWDDINRLVEMHHAVPNEKEGAYRAVMAGLDMYMSNIKSTDFCVHVYELVQEGRIPESSIDLSVRRILRMKYKIGLFQHPYPDCLGFDIVGKKEHKEASFDITKESIVLLKNENNILPLRNAEKILIAGPFIDLKHPLCGSWTYTWQGDIEELYPEEMKTIRQAIEDEFSGSKVVLADSSDISGKSKNADVIVLTIGEYANTESVGDRPDLQPVKAQQKLMEKAVATGKPVIIVLIEGRPLVIDEEIVEKAAAIIWAGLPGEYGAPVLAKVISGKVNPSAKLPFSYPAHLGFHVPYNHKSSVLWSLKKSLKPYLYSFGHGLSYTDFTYTDLMVSDTIIKAGQSLTASVTVTNTGKIGGKEAVLWFITDEYGVITRPVRKLRHFEKQEIQPGGSKTFSFTIDPITDLGYPDETGKIRLEEGTFIISVGNQEMRIELKD